MPRYNYCLVCRSLEDVEWVHSLTQRTGNRAWSSDVAEGWIEESGIVYIHIDVVDGVITHHASSNIQFGSVDLGCLIELLPSRNYNHANMLAFLRMLPNRAMDVLPVNLQKHRLPTDSPFCGVHPVKSKRKITPVLLP